MIKDMRNHIFLKYSDTYDIIAVNVRTIKRNFKILSDNKIVERVDQIKLLTGKY